jgi:hypothetical protein
MITKLLGGAVGLVGVFWLAIAGGWAVHWYDTRPAGQPAWARAHFLWFNWAAHLSLQAQRDALASEIAGLKARQAAVSAQVRVVTKTVVVHDAVAQTKIRTVTQTLLKEVPFAVPASLDPILSSGWVRVHDDAVVGAVSLPGAAGPADDSPSGVDASAALTNDVTNYGACRATAQRLTDLQAWVRGVTAASARPP